MFRFQWELKFVDKYYSKLNGIGCFWTHFEKVECVEFSKITVANLQLLCIVNEKNFGVFLEFFSAINKRSE